MKLISFLSLLTISMTCQYATVFVDMLSHWIGLKILLGLEQDDVDKSYYYDYRDSSGITKSL
jgi:dimeric dUTPase (all-alpha-NTP-PPase superfamily)